jgi:hypothetical protein
MTIHVDSRGEGPALRRRLPVAQRMVLAVVAASLMAAPAYAARTGPSKAAKPKFTIETPLTPFQPSITDPASFSFTAAGNSAASARTQTVERAFRFTPSGQSDNRKALSLGVSTKVVAAAPDRSRSAAPVVAAAAPSAYNVDLSVAWKGFAVSTGFSRFDPGSQPGTVAGARESVDLGLSYRGKNWKTSLQGKAEEGSLLAFSPLERRYSVELGGAYLVAPRFSVTGGVRYKLAPETPSLIEADRPDQAVYLGTNIAF